MCLNSMGVVLKLACQAGVPASGFWHKSKMVAGTRKKPSSWRLKTTSLLLFSIYPVQFETVNPLKPGLRSVITTATIYTLNALCNAHSVLHIYQWGMSPWQPLPKLHERHWYLVSFKFNSVSIPNWVSMNNIYHNQISKTVFSGLGRVIGHCHILPHWPLRDVLVILKV